MTAIGDRLDRAINRAIAERRIVGSVVIVREQGEVVYESARGLSDSEAGTPMTVDKIFRLSSLTKPIVAATILAMGGCRGFGAGRSGDRPSRLLHAQAG